MDMKRFNQALVKKSPEFVRGAYFAASLADVESFGHSEYLLSDRILLKLNLINKRQMHKNKNRTTNAGYIVCYKDGKEWILGSRDLTKFVKNNWMTYEEAREKVAKLKLYSKTYHKNFKLKIISIEW